MTFVADRSPDRTEPPAAASGGAICALADIADGSGRVVTLGHPPEQRCLLLLRSGDRCYAYDNRCPHFGVPLAERDALLIVDPHRSVKCNVHLARFRWEDGYCDSGDCVGESLVSVPLRLEGGLVFLA